MQPKEGPQTFEDWFVRNITSLPDEEAELWLKCWSAGAASQQNVPSTARIQGEEVVEKKSEGTVLVVLRQGTAAPHGDQTAPQIKEIVAGVAKWGKSPMESLELYNAGNDVVAEFRDWSFVKFIEPKNGV